MNGLISSWRLKTTFSLLPWECHACGHSLHILQHRVWGLCGSCIQGLTPMQAPLCSICGLGLSSEDEICLSCREFGTALPDIRCLRSAFLYAGNGPDILRAFKTDGGRPIAKFWATALLPHIHEIWENDMRIIGVPALFRNVLQRGYDQVSLILNNLPQKFRVSIYPHLLVRADGRAQKTLSRADRQSNLLGRITVRPNLKVPPKILLVDDVCTTGATLSLCANILRKHGCRDVCAVTVFRD